MKYQWNRDKAQSNLEKHGIDFADPVGAFEDNWALTIEEQFIDDEQRFVSLGMDFLGRVIVVVYTFREDGIRIISARNATNSERKAYERKRI